MSIWKYIKSGLIYRTHRYLDPFLIPLYRKGIDSKVRKLRQKKTIRVAFVVPELGVWKTESLYQEMRNHERFCPIILIIPSTEVPENADVVERYVKDKGYEYIDMRKTKSSIAAAFGPDIIFYQKPYDYSLPNRYNFRKNCKSLFCYVIYAFHTVNSRDVSETPLINASWQVYYENQITLRSVEALMKHPCGNGVVTGLPMSDDLMLPLEAYDNSWKAIGDGKVRKRIIWGPHHSIGNADHGGIDYSTFLEYSDFMLAMAQKYKDDIQMAFKPHPLLRKNLLAYWSEDKINEYYKRWDEYENTQLELGGYKGLFMHSDAMIHDSGSFTIEYHYTHKPVMYLVKNDKHTDNQNEFAVQAYNLHYKGHNEEEIEKFICDVIAGCDPQYDERKKFFEESLLPPNGKTAAQNIIDAILGC